MSALKTPAIETGVQTPSIPGLRKELGGQLRKILVANRGEISIRVIRSYVKRWAKHPELEMADVSGDALVPMSSYGMPLASHSILKLKPTPLGYDDPGCILARGSLFGTPEQGRCKFTKSYDRLFLLIRNLAF